MPIDALSVSCAQLTRDLLAIAKFLFNVSTGRYLGASARDTVAFLEREKDAKNASSSKRFCLCTRGTFQAQILTIFSRSVMTTHKCAK